METGTVLERKAGEYAARLTEAGFTAAVAKQSLREWSIKVSAALGERRIGDVVIFYSTKQGLHAKYHEVKDKEFVLPLTLCWEGKTGPARRVLAEMPACGAAQPGGPGYAAYVDGCCIGQRVPRGGYGIVLLKDDTLVEEFSGRVEQMESRNVSAELRAVTKLLYECNRRGIKRITIYHDLEGTAAWARGAWKANTPTTQAYVKKVKSSGVRILWVKVDAHSGDPWNERADQLAALGAAMKKAG